MFLKMNSSLLFSWKSYVQGSSVYREDNWASPETCEERDKTEETTATHRSAKERLSLQKHKLCVYKVLGLRYYAFLTNSENALLLYIRQVFCKHESSAGYTIVKTVNVISAW